MLCSTSCLHAHLLFRNRKSQEGLRDVPMATGERESRGWGVRMALFDPSAWGQGAPHGPGHAFASLEWISETQSFSLNGGKCVVPDTFYFFNKIKFQAQRKRRRVSGTIWFCKHCPHTDINASLVHDSYLGLFNSIELFTDVTFRYESSM